MIIRFHFEDHGQDFLWWDVEDKVGEPGAVLDAGPFQASIWADGKHFVNLSEEYKIGDRLTITNDLQRSIETGHSRLLKYPIKRIERRPGYETHLLLPNA
ncbi:hypothetical protein [Agrobacterium tumefaciens]|uniref:hypothetical protein n=1 Tax=Agrobacterium tumefaciens TaxID=358 RepID=UPI001F36F71B|nr:hypothetical protein [Agrobacterium tumefaciens]WCK01057.1 hypothetical protein G6L31_007175 [Agrobacterium tumefaciens]